jgi:hypothetical protein
MIVRLLLLAATALAPLSPTLAQSRMRQIPAPASQAWTHVATKIALPARLGGLNRTEIRDTGAAELDVIITYQSEDRSAEATIFIFRPQVADPAIWFDRALTSMLARRDSALAPQSGLAVRSLAPGLVGLRTTAAASGSAYLATGLGVAGVDGWIVKLRLSTKEADLAALDSLFDRVITDLALPATTNAGLQPLQACPSPLKFKKAKVLKPNGAQALLGATLAMMAQKPDTQKTAATFCRDAASGPEFGVYRANATQDGYVLALADAGRLISVHKTLSLNGGQRYAVTFQDLDRSFVFDDLTALPSPQQALAHVNGSRPTASMKVESQTITLDANTLK